MNDKKTIKKKINPSEHTNVSMVKMLRKIRNKVSRDTQEMNSDELKKYISQKLKE